MSLGTYLLVGLAGSAGALARYGVDQAVGARVGRRFPWGILVVNLSGTFLLGLLVGAALSTDALRLAGAALLGAYTTFSTWMLDLHRLGWDGRRRSVLLDLVAPLVLGLAVAFLGRAIGRAL